jgi:CTP synthase
MQSKYIFVTGGVLSSLGKGLAASAIGMLLEAQGLRISMMKLDPYLNVDPGTMNPYQHGEVYVTDDGAETDLDLGHYFRFTHSPLSQKSNATSGQIYYEVIKRERRGDYLGKTVQMIPHITDEIKHRIQTCSKQAKADITIVEIGGTVGDIESLTFLEAIRQLRYEYPADCVDIHVTYVPYMKAAGEVKTKPSQHSVQALREIGIVPDIILCRCETPLPADVKQKLSLFCNVKEDAVIEAVDVPSTIYELPLYLHKQGIEKQILQRLSIPIRKPNLKPWEALIKSIKEPKGELTIGVIGKYVQHADAYKSIFEALGHAGARIGMKVNIQKFEPDTFDEEKELPAHARHCDGYLIPGGFGDRGWEGKILAAKFCREQKVPYFGICLGMQVLCVEFARHVLKLKDANSTEMNADTKHPIISLLEEQRVVSERGGTMRLGAYPCKIKKQTHAHKAYGKDLIAERHRHRYEFNNEYKKQAEEKGLIISGIYPEKNLVEIVEIKGHPWMLGVQYHPEFTSKPIEPHPLFLDFVRAVHAFRLHKKKKK